MKTKRTKNENEVTSKLKKIYRDAYLELQYAQVQFVSEQMAGAARLLNGDYSLVIILAVLGQRSIEAVLFDADDISRRCMSATSISEITHIPRETVRRKLKYLKNLQLVEHHEDKGWFVPGQPHSSKARDYFSEEQHFFIQRLAKLYASIETILQNQAQDALISAALRVSRL